MRENFMSDEKRGFLDRFKLPDMSEMGEVFRRFITTADAKLDAQTAAIKILGEKVRDLNVTIGKLEQQFAERWAGGIAAGADGGGVFVTTDAGGGSGVADGNDAESDTAGTGDGAGNGNPTDQASDGGIAAICSEIGLAAE
jgi:hypothetical protein